MYAGTPKDIQQTNLFGLWNDGNGISLEWRISLPLSLILFLCRPFCFQNIALAAIMKQLQ